MSGVLSAVDLYCNTAVVKVSLSGGKIFTVAGTLAQGHLILGITAK